MKHFFLVFEKVIRYAASGCTEKRDEELFSAIKFLADNQMGNLENSQQAQFNIKDCLENTYENSIQVSKKTSNRDVFQDQNFLIKRINVRFQKDKHAYITPLFCRRRTNTFAAANILSKHKRLSEI